MTSTERYSLKSDERYLHVRYHLPVGDVVVIYTLSGVFLTSEILKR